MGFIYCITNNINGKKYIGQTVKSNVKTRFKEHKADSKRHTDIPLYKAFRKYGVENFSIEVLEEVVDEKLSEREAYWINKLDTFNSYKGYNATLGGQGGRRKYTEADKETMMFYWRFGMTITEITETMGVSYKTVSDVVSCLPDFKEKTQLVITDRIRKAKGRKVDQYTLDGEYVASYDTATDAQKALGMSSSTQIIVCCKNPSHTCHGFLFRYSGDEPPKKGVHHGKRRSVDQYDLQGNYLGTYKSCTDAAKAIDSKPGTISDVCRGVMKSVKGYIFKYHD